MMIEKHKKNLLLANESITQGDHEGFLNYCTEDTHWNFMGNQELNGKQEVRKWMSKNYMYPPVFDVHKLIGEGEYVTALGDITLKDQEGKPTHYSYCDVWRFRDGKLAELKAFVVEK